MDSNEVRLTRIYSAPVAQVWEAWVDPAQVGQWWGPRGFSISTVRKEVRTGGDWLYTMRGPDGVEYPNHTRFIEVIPGSRLSYDHGGFEDRPPLFRVEVTFTESGERTRMEMTMNFASAEAATEARKMIRQANGDSTWDRLAEYLENQTSGKDVFVINRSFDVDQETLYEAWTNPRHIMQWTPPTGFLGRYLSVEIRPGGQAFYEMSGNGVVLYGKANYLELLRPNHLVYTQVFSDRDGNISRHPLAPTWPETMKTTVDFSPEGPARTRVTLQWEVSGPATAEERQMFSGAKAGMMMGWTGSFDKLEEYLKSGFRQSLGN